MSQNLPFSPAARRAVSALFTAQAQQNVEWKSEVESLGDGNYRIVLTAAIPERSTCMT